MLSESLLKELHQIFKEEFGIELKQQELRETADSLVGYFDLLAKIYHRQNTVKIKNN